MGLDTTLSATVERGEVTFTFRVVNAGTTAIDLTFRSGKRADVIVRDVDSGVEVWRWSDGRMFTQALSRATLRPGEQIEETYTWPDPPPGTYVATGVLEADRDVSSETELTV